MRILKLHPLLKLANSYVLDSPQPSNLSYFWNFGSLLTFCLMIQIVTGVTLAMHYNPSVQEAFNSAEYIMRDVNNGWLIRYLHSNTASAFFFLLYLHIDRGLHYEYYKAKFFLLFSLINLLFIKFIANNKLLISESRASTRIILQQSLNKGIGIILLLSNSGNLSITILNYDKFLEFMRSFTPSINLPSTRNIADIPTFPPYTPKCNSSLYLPSPPSSETFITFHEVKLNFVRYNMDILTWEKLFYLFHNNLPIFMGLAAIILYSCLPRLNNLLNYVIDISSNYFSNIFDRSLNSINDIINRLYGLNFRFIYNIFIIDTTNSSNTSIRFFNRFIGSGNANRVRQARLITQNRARVLTHINAIYTEVQQYTLLLQQLNQYASYTQREDGQYENLQLSIYPYSFDILVNTNIVLYNHIMDLFQRTNNLSESISGHIYDIAVLLGVNSSIFENVFPNEEIIDNMDLYPLIENYVNTSRFYDIEYFQQVFNESKIDYTTNNFN